LEGVQRYLAFAIFIAAVMGCADDKAKAPPPLQPLSGSADSNDDRDSDNESEPETTVAAANEEEPGEQSGPCSVSFTKDVMPKLVASCGSAACHMETNEPSVDEATPQITYESLRDFGFDDEAWTDPHPTDSKLDEPSLKAAIDGWRKCGAPFE
jgi:hypothetical protein